MLKRLLRKEFKTQCCFRFKLPKSMISLSFEFEMKNG